MSQRTENYFSPLGRHRRIQLKNGDDDRGYLCSIIQDQNWLEHGYVKVDSIISLLDEDFRAANQLPRVGIKHDKSVPDPLPNPRVMHLQLYDEEGLLHSALENRVGKRTTEDRIHKEILQGKKYGDFHENPLYFIVGILVMYDCDTRDARPPSHEDGRRQQSSATTIPQTCAVGGRDPENVGGLVSKEWSMEFVVKNADQALEGGQIIGIQCQMFHKSVWHLGFRGAKLDGRLHDSKRMFELVSKEPEHRAS